MTGLPDLNSADIVIRAIEGWRGAAPLVVGICGAQGSGKSTLCEAVATGLNARDIATVILSLDDLYLAPEDRPVAAHPLFKTRGVPGTHDPISGIRIIDAFRRGQAVSSPRFDKATDRPVPCGKEDMFAGVLLLEGWCVGAVSQVETDLIAPVNALERDEDPDGVWRRYVNAQLAGPYAALFAKLDRLILLAAPGFEVVQGWRTQQEHDLRRKLALEGRTGGMEDVQITRFIQHYERLTRHILTEMPARADLTIRLDAQRQPVDIIDPL
ncbi:kinase [Asticcacaulis sp. BYS171W]|uniref:Kinase n=1 Tax=Asticcacaulis aquaticus TaxID=2984212 RepID=A0ABT5HVS9_9CAUL|nr:kinase [Asticcacaulis aquaticus]MDC7684197.1 kinase [Asticcacaulis aquaticus]